jgi:hypothetical protein
VTLCESWFPALIEYNMTQRYALVGKTRSGKTRFAITLAGMFAQYLYYPFEQWWIDTKGSLEDLNTLRQFGFRNGASPQDMKSQGAIPGALYFHLEPTDYTDDLSVVRQAQTIFAAAMRRAQNERLDYNNLLITVDEYTSVVPSTRSPGSALKDVFARGGGLKTGIIGCTQEPSFVPRQLISQASHLFLFSLSLDYDIDRIRKMVPSYVPPIERGDPYGLYHVYLDGTNQEIEYFHHQMEWYESINIEVPTYLVAS